MNAWPKGLPLLPAVPVGFDRWVYRGVKYASPRAIMVTSFDETMDTEWDPVAMFQKRGDEHTHYAEAVIDHHEICECGECGCVPEDEAREELKTLKLDEQRKALAEARQRIIARCETVRGWLQQPAPDATIANWSGIVEGLAQARRIIGGMWDELPVPMPQAVIDHQNAIAGE